MPSPAPLQGIKILDEIMADLPAGSATSIAIAKLKTEIEKLQAKAINFEHQLAAQNLKPDLTGEAVKILQGLFASDGCPLTADVFADASISEIKSSRNHLDALVEMGFVERFKRAPKTRRHIPDEFIISANGRAYLLEKGLLPKTS